MFVINHRGVADAPDWLQIASERPDAASETIQKLHQQQYRLGHQGQQQVQINVFLKKVKNVGQIFQTHY